MDDLLSQLRDIHGLDAAGWWPLAPGWYGLAGLLVLAGALVAGVIRARQKRARGARAEMLARLAALRGGGATTKERAAALSEILRLLAMQGHGRGACAGLEGAEWLGWLSRHDPKGFDWLENGRILIEAPYAPPALTEDRNLEPLIRAAEKWVR